jgi:hypothetical protein
MTGPEVSRNFEQIGGRNVLVGNAFTGTTTITFNDQNGKLCQVGSFGQSTHPRLIDGSPASPEIHRVILFPRNDDFIYRQDISDQLDTLLPSSSKSQSAALWGLGGTG